MQQTNMRRYNREAKQNASRPFIVALMSVVCRGSTGDNMKEEKELRAKQQQKNSVAAGRNNSIKTTEGELTNNHHDDIAT